MHPRNPYAKEAPNFAALAKEYPDLKSCLAGETKNGVCRIDFGNDKSLGTLTRAILKCHFDLTFSLPKGTLCPTVTNRLNYLAWIEDLLLLLNKDPHRDRTIRGIDIGTGASCIYPLLGVRLHPQWTWIATDIDPLSVQSAQQNVTTNNLDQRILIYHNHTQDTLSSVLEAEIVQSFMAKQHEAITSEASFDFCMCNPPFYASQEEIDASRQLKADEPYTACHGRAVEMVTKGGEVGFVKRMIAESLENPLKISWYTSMLGMKSSLSIIQDYLTKHHIRYCSTKFVQGKTGRWAIAWTHTTTIPQTPFPIVQTHDHEAATPSDHMSPSHVNLYLPSTLSLNAILDYIRENMYPDSIDAARRVVTFGAPSWTRKARRARQQRERGDVDGVNGDAAGERPTKRPRRAATAEPCLVVRLGYRHFMHLCPDDQRPTPLPRRKEGDPTWAPTPRTLTQLHVERLTGCTALFHGFCHHLSKQHGLRKHTINGQQ